MPVIINNPNFKRVYSNQPTNTAPSVSPVIPNNGSQPVPNNGLLVKSVSAGGANIVNPNTENVLQQNKFNTERQLNTELDQQQAASITKYSKENNKMAGDLQPMEIADALGDNATVADVKKWYDLLHPKTTQSPEINIAKKNEAQIGVEQSNNQKLFDFVKSNNLNLDDRSTENRAKLLKVVGSQTLLDPLFKIWDSAKAGNKQAQTTSAIEAVGTMINYANKVPSARGPEALLQGAENWAKGKLNAQGVGEYKNAFDSLVNFVAPLLVLGLGQDKVSDSDQKTFAVAIGTLSSPAQIERFAGMQTIENIINKYTADNGSQYDLSKALPSALKVQFQKFKEENPPVDIKADSPNGAPGQSSPVTLDQIKAQLDALNKTQSEAQKRIDELKKKAQQ